MWTLRLAAVPASGRVPAAKTAPRGSVRPSLTGIGLEESGTARAALPDKFVGTDLAIARGVHTEQLDECHRSASTRREPQAAEQSAFVGRF